MIYISQKRKYMSNHSNTNVQVTQFISGMNHPLALEINRLREIILSANQDISENIKWNGPNYMHYGEDRITLRIQPPKQIQLIFHRGAKKLEQPSRKLIEDHKGILNWRENDRAIATFKTLEEIDANTENLATIIKAWLSATQMK